MKKTGSKLQSWIELPVPHKGLAVPGSAAECARCRKESGRTFQVRIVKLGGATLRTEDWCLNCTLAQDRVIDQLTRWGEVEVY